MIHNVSHCTGALKYLFILGSKVSLPGKALHSTFLAVSHFQSFWLFLDHYHYLRKISSFYQATPKFAQDKICLGHPNLLL